MTTARHTLLLAALTVALAGPAGAQLGITEQVREHVRARIDAGWVPGLVIGVIDSTGPRYFAAGISAPDSGTPVGPRTVFEIGSITKVFTGLLLADMALRGTIRLDDPASRYLPESVPVPAYGEQPITLELLAAQRSGLPRLPPNLEPADSTNPYADYDAARLYTYLRTAILTRAPGAAYEYSNLGAGFLGFLLARAEGGTYEDVLTYRVLRPLGLSATGITLDSTARRRLAQGSVDGRPAPGWDFDALAGAGALRSTAEDMLRFLGAAMELTPGPLAPAFRLAAEPRYDAGPPGMRIGLGWHVREGPGGRIVWHNGGTGGYRSWAGYDPDRRVGAVVLANSTDGVDDLGFHLLDPGSPLAEVRTPITLPAAVLDEYVGRYPLAPSFVLTVSREGPDLTVQATGQPAFALYASARDEFFLRIVDASISFTRGADGRVAGLVLHQGGRDLPAARAD